MGKNNKYKNHINAVTPERHEEIKKQISDLMEHGTESGQRSFSEAELALELGLEGRERGEMASCLDELSDSGSVIKNRKGKYRRPEPDSVITGRVEITRRGFGFLIPDGGGEDVFLPREDLKGAADGDRVLVKIDLGRRRARAGRRYGWVIKILERGVTEVTGTVQSGRRYAFVVSDNRRFPDVYISSNETLGAVTGDKVRAVITEYSNGGLGPRGRIVEIYGHAGEPEAEYRAVLRQYHIPEAFDEAVISEAEAVSRGAEDTACEDANAATEKAPVDILHGIIGRIFKNGKHQKSKDAQVDKYGQREDLRGRLIITIDGPDAKDLDDAVNVEKRPDGSFLLGVHIADVSHYVKEGSALDAEALRRGCSVYLLDHVVPMLPEQLSNGVCSLNQGEDRLTLSMEAEIGSDGEILSYRIFESVIRSSARMVYNDVSDIIEKHDEELMTMYSELCPMIFAMDELAAILREKRMKGGSLDFDIDESYIELDEKGLPVDVRPAERRVANRIIEEFMLTANKIVAEHHYWMDVPFVYRVHEKPDPERMESFKTFAATLGYTLKGSCDSIHPAALRDILLQAEGSDAEAIINRIMLRSMKKADYQPVCGGHFGLGFKYYCHFTSPIRRYPDLMVHRIIKEIMHGAPDSLTMSEKRRADMSAKVENACDTASAQERNAVAAERTIEKKKKVQYMSSHIGEEYDGIISGVLASGFFVELPDTVEGYVALKSLKDDYYSLDADNYRIIGEHTRRLYRVGGRVRVRVSSADPVTDEIELTLI